MRESYVRPVTSASEPTSRRLAVWRFRLIALVVLVLLAALTLAVASRFVHTEQSPTFGSLGPLGSSAPVSGSAAA